jgi:hypothetical protein
MHRPASQLSDQTFIQAASPDLLSRGERFESRTGYKLYRLVFFVLFLFFQATARIVQPLLDLHGFYLHIFGIMRLSH